MRRILKFVKKMKDERIKKEWCITNIPRNKQIVSLCLNLMYHQIDDIYIRDMVDYYEISIHSNIFNVILSFFRLFYVNHKIRKIDKKAFVYLRRV